MDDFLNSLKTSGITFDEKEKKAAKLKRGD